MALEVFEREVEDISILDLIGRLTEGSAHDCFSQAVLKLVEGGKTRVLVNLKEIAHLDSAGIGFLVSSHSDVKQAGGDLRVFNARTPHLDEAIRTELSKALTVYENEQEAVDSFVYGHAVPHFDILEFVKSVREERQVEGEQLIHSDSKSKPESVEE
jgi:anti-sigma B factor antagonist